MTISRASFLSEILSDKPIPMGKLAYFRGRLRGRIYDLVVTEFLSPSNESAPNKAKLAERIGRRPEQITRWLSTPSNWTLDTLSDLLLAMGCEPSIGLTPLVGAEAVDDASVHDHEGVSTATVADPTIPPIVGTSGQTRRRPATTEVERVPLPGKGRK